MISQNATVDESCGQGGQNVGLGIMSGGHGGHGNGQHGHVGPVVSSHDSYSGGGGRYSGGDSSGGTGGGGDTGGSGC